MIKSTQDRIMKIQGETLSKLLGLSKVTFFELNELRAIRSADVGSKLKFRGEEVTITMSAHALSELIIDKIQKKK